MTYVVDENAEIEAVRPKAKPEGHARGDPRLDLAGRDPAAVKATFPPEPLASQTLA